MVSINVAEVYNRNAAYWDSRLYRGVYHGAYVRLFQRLKHGSARGSAKRVLDCGIGAGLLSESWIDTGERPLEMYGVDVSSRLLEMAGLKLGRLGVCPLLASGDIANLPFRRDAMDVVLSALVLEHVPEPLAAIREMARVVRRDGLIVLVATRSGAPDHFFRRKYNYRPYPREAILNWMTTAGLASVTSYELSGIARLFARAYVGLKS